MGDGIVNLKGGVRVRPSRPMRQQLFFVSQPDQPQSWLDAAQSLLAGGHQKIAARLIGRGAEAIADALGSDLGEAVMVLPERGDPSGVDAQSANAVMLLGDGRSDIGAALLDYLDREDVTLVAPVTKRHWQALPLYLISIPKAGTHLLFRLAEALGYGAGGQAPDKPRGGKWYYLLNTNAHTTAHEFFVEAVQKAPFGNRAHPFMHSPTLFNYRNPLDILVSEANYFHVDGNSPLASMLSSLSYEERIDRLLDDPWLLGTIRDRVGAFVPWLDCSNVIPVSFEEMIGETGGGSDRELQALVWSLQLKLQVPGRPADIAARMSVRAGPTFREGKAGSHKEKLSPGTLRRFKALPQDFMAAFGYTLDNDSAVLPSRALAFRRRPLVLSETHSTDVPIQIQTEYFGHNIVSFRERFYAVPMDMGPIDLATLSGDALARFRNSDDKKTLMGRLSAIYALQQGGAFDELFKTKLPEIVKTVRFALLSPVGDEPELTARISESLSSFEDQLLAKLSDALIVEVASKIGPLLVPELLERLEAELRASLLPALQDAFLQSLHQPLPQLELPGLEPASVQPRASKQEVAGQDPFQSKLFDQLRMDIFDAICSPIAGQFHRELARVMTPDIINAIQPAIQARLDQAAVGAVRDLGSFLRYRLWCRADVYLAVPRGAGPVDPHDVALRHERGVIVSSSEWRLRLKILWKWVRWAYWDGAKV